MRELQATWPAHLNTIKIQKQWNISYQKRASENVLWKQPCRTRYKTNCEKKFYFYSARESWSNFYSIRSKWKVYLLRNLAAHLDNILSVVCQNHSSSLTKKNAEIWHYLILIWKAGFSIGAHFCVYIELKNLRICVDAPAALFLVLVSSSRSGDLFLARTEAAAQRIRQIHNSFAISDEKHYTLITKNTKSLFNIFVVYSYCDRLSRVHFQRYDYLCNNKVTLWRRDANAPPA